MLPLRLFMENFLCHSTTYIDFSSFQSALIVAKINDNEELSNGAGKTSIFKAIEYVLFNKIDMKLESIIRDDCSNCKVILDFEYNGDVYRVSRKRTKKSADFALFKKVFNNDEGAFIETSDEYFLPTDASKLKDHWENLSGTRDVDTEKELFKIIKTNYKSFIGTVHFIQNDFGGIATATPEKRKQMFKDALELSFYSKLEKLAKDKYAKISKLIDKNDIIIETLGNVDEDLINLQKSLNDNCLQLKSLNESLSEIQIQENNYNDKKIKTSKKLEEIKGSVSSLMLSKKALLSEINSLNSSLSDYKSKSKKIISQAKSLISDIESLEKKLSKLKSVDVSKIFEIEKDSEALKNKESEYNAIIQANMLKYEELNIPLPDDDLCKHCRQKMTKEHKENCTKAIKIELDECKKTIKETKSKINSIKNLLLENNAKINELKKVKSTIENIEYNITNKKSDLNSKKSMHKEYDSFIKTQQKSLDDKNKTLSELEEKMDFSSVSNIDKLEKELSKIQIDLNNTVNKKQNITKQVSHINSTKAVIDHNIKEKKSDKNKLKSLLDEKEKLTKEAEYYPSVITAFGTSGIPNLIIQDVLDDLQIEANNLLGQLQPGLQLEFIVEKENSDDGTLDIKYYVNGRKRYYEQLSGAMKLRVMFSLKLGLSFLLQKTMGFNIPLLLLDEIDQSLDKAGIDAFADIVKFFQQDFKILVITHNDRLKGKIPNIIMVSQDRNKVSQAKVVNGV